MFSIRRRAVLAAAALVAVPSLLLAWGNWGHQHVNRAAVLALPAPMRTFFYNHIDFVVTEAVIPDSRKYVLNDKPEGPRHYIDLENYSEDLNSIPRASADAYAKYDAALLDKEGRLPWYVQDMLTKLTTAMKKQHKDEILFVAADLGHYIGDATQPLHTSANHDGQKTGQKGIHAFYEAQMVEQFGKTYNFKLAEPKFISDPTAEIWRVVLQSHAAADTLLAVEKKLAAATPADQILEANNGQPRKNVFNATYHTQPYTAAYHQALNRMVERQLRTAAQTTANFWYTAWVNAGKPDLTKLDTEYTTKSHEHNLKEELKTLDKTGKLVDFSSFAEYPQGK